MILVDTSAWIAFFRNTGSAAIQVDDALASNDATICGPIETELHRGLRSKKEREIVLGLFEGCHKLEQPTDLWIAAGELGYFLQRKGVTCKTLDLLIATYALAYHVPVLSTDRDFQHMVEAGVPLQLT